MISIEEYKANPCRFFSAPYYKMKNIKIPSNMLIIHHEDYCVDYYNEYLDTMYFRLKHNLQNVEKAKLSIRFKYKNVNINSAEDLEKVVYIINKCYSDIHVNMNEVLKWSVSEVFCDDLWLFIFDDDKNVPAALGIAELDKETGEGSLEWIQVLPEYRNLGLGEALVKGLLIKLKGSADFITVSGKVNNKTNPERLYRKCGFKGNDIWHVLVKKD